MDKFKDALQRFANKMNQIELLIIIQRSLMILTPVTLVGSVFPCWQASPSTHIRSLLQTPALSMYLIMHTTPPSGI